MAQAQVKYTNHSNVQYEEDVHWVNNLDDDINANLQDISEAVRQHYGDQINGFENTNEQNISLDEAINHLNVTSVRSCSHCSKPRRVKYIRQLKKGQHISMPGQKFTRFIKDKRKLKTMYDHHAIIKEIIETNGSVANMTIIHFSCAKNGKFMVFEETKEYDLSKDELYIVVYIHPRYNADKIVERAQSVLTENGKWKPYSLLRNNCEHFATWCVIGESDSFQVESFQQRIAWLINRVFSQFSYLGMAVKKVVSRIPFLSADDIAAGFQAAYPAVVIGVADGVYMLYCIFRTILDVIKYKKKQICRSCLNGKLQDLWMPFGVTLLGLITIPLILSGGVVIPGYILMSLLSISLSLSIARLRKVLASPFTVDRRIIKTVDELRDGDVISFSRFGFQHCCIVSEVNYDSGQVRVIHYGFFSSLCEKRKIVEENIEINALKVYLLDCEHLNTFHRDIVVSRARSRIGETKWNYKSNRSDHFAYWAKIMSNAYEGFDLTCSYSQADYCSKITLFIEDIEIHRYEDLNIGDVVKSSVIGTIYDMGILSSLKSLEGSDGRKLEMKVITYGFSRVVACEKYLIDLNTDRLFVKIYNPAQCYEMEQRARNAKRLVNQQNKWDNTEGFIMHCIESASDKLRVLKLNELGEGDMVSFPYFGKQHRGIVSGVSADTGHVRVIHYGSSSFFDTRQILEEYIKLDVEKKKVYLLNFKTSVTYDKHVVVSRARSRIGETKYNLITNRSSDFAHWAKIKSDNAEKSDSIGHLLSSKVPFFVEKREIYCHEELKIGDVVKFSDIGKNAGILSSLKLLEGSNGRILEVEIIEYGVPAVVTCKKYCIDLNTDSLFVKIYNPAQCYEMEQRARNAKQLVNQRKKWDNTEGFIRHCIEFAPNKLRVLKLNELCEGDLVSFPYFDYQNCGIVSGVNADTGHIRVIHYGSSSLFDTRQILEEYIELDVENKEVNLLNFPTSATYDKDVVVSRARSRIGTTYWEVKSNRSFHFARWAKVKTNDAKELDSTI